MGSRGFSARGVGVDVVCCSLLFVVVVIEVVGLISEARNKATAAAKTNKAAADFVTDPAANVPPTPGALFVVFLWLLASRLTGPPSMRSNEARDTLSRGEGVRHLRERSASTLTTATAPASPTATVSPT